MKTKIIATISALFFLMVGVIIVPSLTSGTNQDRSWKIEVVIHPAGSLSNNYFIQIDEYNIIRTRFGIRNSTSITFHEEILSEVRNEKERILSDEMQIVLSLVRELEAVGVIDETDIGNGTWNWEVVLIYNGVRYAMDYSLANLMVNHLEETLHEGAYFLEHYEIFLRLVDEIMQLSPIEIAIF